MEHEDRYAGMPEQVRQKAMETDSLIEQAYGKGKTGDKNPDQAPGQQPSVDPKPEPQPQPGENWEQKFHTLQGKYNSEVPRLHADNRELSSTIATLRQEMDAIKAQVANQQQAEESPPASNPNERTLDPRKFEHLGDEVVEIVETFNSHVESLKQAIGERDNIINNLQAQVHGVQETQGQQATMSFEDKLTKDFPSWRNLINDRSFIEWLDNQGLIFSDENGKSYTILDVHAQKGSVAKIVDVFERYSRETSPEAPKDPENPPHTPPEQPVNSGLEEHLAPQLNGGDGGAPEDSKPVYSNEEINDFYAKLRRKQFPFEACGQIVSSEEDAGVLEMKITRADLEGRVR